METFAVHMYGGVCVGCVGVCVVSVQMRVFIYAIVCVVGIVGFGVYLNLPGAGFRVIRNALTPGGGSPLHSGGLKPATDPNRVRSGA